MDDMFKYPVFFECHNVQQKHMKKIETHFQIKRRSGRGECGSLKRINNNIYSVAFKDQSDQQRFLQKSEHVVDDLVFTVRDSLEPGSSSPVREDSVSVQDFNDAIRLEEAVHQPDQAESTPKRIVILGKTGSGKSNLANTIFGEELFTTNHTPNSGTSRCQAETRSVHRRNITLIDTPGFFDTERSEEALKPEIVRCITECAPGPHAFLIVLKVEKFTEQEEAVMSQICQYFSEDALKYTVIVFTHGDQLHEGKKIEEFVSGNKKLSDLVKKCGGRCHVIDNRYWKKNEEDNYRNNRVQVEKLLNTIDKMVMENNGGFYTNEMLQETEREIQKEEEQIRQKGGNLTPQQIRAQARAKVHNKYWVRLAGVGTGVVVGALLGVPAMIGLMITAVRNCVIFFTCLEEKVLQKEAGGKLLAGGAAGATVAGGAGVGAAVGAAGEAAAAAAAVATGEAAAGTAVGLSAAAGAGIGLAVVAAAAGVAGGVIGYKASEGAETPGEAAKKAAKEVYNKVKSTFDFSSSKHNAKEQQLDTKPLLDD